LNFVAQTASEIAGGPRSKFWAGPPAPRRPRGQKFLYDALVLANIYLGLQFELCSSSRFRDSRGPPLQILGGAPCHQTTAGGKIFLYDALVLANVYSGIQFELCSSKRFQDSRGPQKWGAHSPVRGHPRGSKVVPLNSWGRVSY